MSAILPGGRDRRFEHDLAMSGNCGGFHFGLRDGNVDRFFDADIDINDADRRSRHPVSLANEIGHAAGIPRVDRAIGDHIDRRSMALATSPAGSCWSENMR